MADKIKTVPNQRIVTVSKAPTDKKNLYTTNNLDALDEAAGRLKSLGGFKLYMYLAKNQNEYEFALSSNHFQLWSRMGIKAYRTAFDELLSQGYLVRKNDNSNIYIFYDKAQTEDITASKDNVIIEYQQVTETKSKEFKF